ncbi:hypothetical protein GCM10009858_15960 [Terrabacter carboxydivorans]|uniref:Uncharacterized protein n=1 Tax=Terrabacter carboxydivorans TaxID=619730 RepID=A0ABN3L7J8_9MICO
MLRAGRVEPLPEPPEPPGRPVPVPPVPPFVPVEPTPDAECPDDEDEVPLPVVPPPAAEPVALPVPPLAEDVPPEELEPDPDAAPPDVFDPPALVAAAAPVAPAAELVLVVAVWSAMSEVWSCASVACAERRAARSAVGSMVAKACPEVTWSPTATWTRVTVPLAGNVAVTWSTRWAVPVRVST